jgi:hypothetical protein
MQSHLSISNDNRYEIIQALTEKMRHAHLEWRRWDWEAKQRLGVATAGPSMAEDTLALEQARQSMENANKAIGDYQNASQALTELMVHGILPSEYVDT